MKRLAFLVTALTLLSFAFDVSAQRWPKPKPKPPPAEEKPPPPPPPPPTPSELAAEGIRLYEAGQFQEAADNLEKAESSYHSVVNTLYLARALAKLGRNKDAHAYYAMIVTERLPNWASRESLEAQHHAAREAAELRASLGCARVIVRGGEVKKVRIDGTEVAIENLYLPIALDPGTHRFDVDGEHGSVTGDVVVPERGTAKLELMLPQPKKGEGGEGDASEADDGEPANVPLYISYGLYGLGGLLALNGGTLGLLALVNASEIEDRCAISRCSLIDVVDARATNEMADASTGLLIAAGAVLTTAVVLHVVFGGKGQEGVEAALNVSPNGFMFEGRF